MRPTRIIAATVLVLALAACVPTVASAGPCVPDLPCVAEGAVPPAVASCNRFSGRDDCPYFTHGWTCGASSFENGELVVDEDSCSEVWWPRCGRRMRKASFIDGHWVTPRKRKIKCESWNG